MRAIPCPVATIAPSAEARPYEHLVLDFLAYLEFERGLSRNTLEAYRSDLLQFGRFLEARGADAVTAKAADVSDFLSDLAAGDGNGRAPASPATIHRKAACLRSFYRHLRREGVRETDPTATITGPRRGQRLPKVLNRGEVRSCSPSRGHRADRAARPGDARADVRMRPARVGGDRHGRGRPGPRGRRAARARQGAEGARRAGRQGGDRGDPHLHRARPQPAYYAAAWRRSSSSTSAASRSPARASTRSSAATRRRQAWPTG